MKRCIVCGNIGDPDSKVCEICGNPYIETPDETDVGNDSEQAKETPETEHSAETVEAETAGAEETETEETETEETEYDQRIEYKDQELSSGERGPESGLERFTDPDLEARLEAFQLPEEEEIVEEGPDLEAKLGAFGESEEAEEPVNHTEAEPERVSEPSRPVHTRRPAESSGTDGQTEQRPRRMKSGPHIYGQESSSAYSGSQGVIRRDVQGRPAAAPTQRRTPEGQRRPVNRQSTAQASPNRNPRQDTNGQTRQQARPMNAANGPRNQASGGQGMNRRPVNAQGRPVHETQGRPANAQGRPVISQNHQQGRPAGEPNRMQGQPEYGARPSGYGIQQEGYGSSSFKSGRSKKIADTAREVFHSPIFLLVAVFYTIHLISSVAAIFLNQLNYAQISNLIAGIGLPAQLSGYVGMFQSALNSLSSGMIGVNLVLQIPTLLFCIGLWICCVSGRSQGEMPGSGFLLMRIVVIIDMIKACAVLLIVLILSVTLMIAAWGAGTTGLIVVAVITLILAMVVTMAVIMHFFCYLATIRTMQVNTGSGEAYGRVSAYVAVVNMVISLFSIISILSGIVNLEITGITGGVSSLVWMILFGIWIFRYRNAMIEYED